MPLSTYQIIVTDNDPQWTSFIDITAGTTGLVNELQDIKATLRTVSLLTPWISLVGLEGSWAGNLAWTFVDGTHASIQGDQRPSTGTGYLQVGQRVRAFVTAGTIYGQISALGFGSSITTATFVWDSGTLDSGLSDIQTGGDPNAIANSVQTQSQTPLFAVITNGGSGAVFTGALSPVPAGYVTGQMYVLKWTQASQGSDTVNLNGFGALPVVKNVNGAYVNVAAGDIPAGAYTPVVFAGSNFYIGPLNTTAQFLVQARAYKPTDQTVASSTTLVNDTALSFPIAANEVWQFEIDLYATFDGASASGIKAAFTVPSGATLQWIAMANAGNSLTPITTSGSTLDLDNGGATATGYMSKIIGQVLNGATPGTVQFQWAQNTSDATATIVKAGSSLVAVRMSP